MIPELDNQLHAWDADLIPEIRVMLAALPTPIRVPGLPADQTMTNRTFVVEALTRAYSHAHKIDAPATIRPLVTHAIATTIAAFGLMARTLNTPERAWESLPRAWDAIADARDHARAVAAFYRVQPEEEETLLTW